jgi:hypothetical protein
LPIQTPEQKGFIMLTPPFHASVARRNTGLVPVLAVTVALSLLAGCQQPNPGETTHKLTVAWPIFDSEKWEGVNPDGTRYYKEKGDACVWLASWEKERTYDKDGFLTYRKERSGSFLADSQVEESKDFIIKQSRVLFFPHYSREVKNPATGVIEKEKK